MAASTMSASRRGVVVTSAVVAPGGVGQELLLAAVHPDVGVEDAERGAHARAQGLLPGGRRELPAELARQGEHRLAPVLLGLDEGAVHVEQHRLQPLGVRSAGLRGAHCVHGTARSRAGPVPAQAPDVTVTAPGDVLERPPGGVPGPRPGSRPELARAYGPVHRLAASWRAVRGTGSFSEWWGAG